MASSVLARLAVVIDGQTATFNKAMAQSQSQLAGFQKSISTVGAALGLTFGATAIFAGLKNAVGILKDFEKQMDTVRAITGATGAEFDQLRNSALLLGKTTKFTSQEVAELQTEFGRLGFTTQEILDATEATINLSIATGEDLAKSADVAGSTIRSFGLNANQTGRIVDVMAESFNRSALGLENFSEAMKYVAPIAAQAGISIEQTTALLGTLADAGIRGSSAGTSLRKIITDLGGESGTLSEKLKSLADKGLTGAEAMSEVGRTAYASLLVLAKNTEKTEALTVALDGAAGAAEKTAKIMGDNLAGDLDKLSSAYEGLILSNNGATSGLRTFVQLGTNLITSLTSQNGLLGENAGWFAKLVTLVPRLVVGLAELANAALGGEQPLENVRKQLELLNAVRNKAQQEGDTETEQKATLAIISLTNKYKLLKAQVDESNKSNEQSAAALNDVNAAAERQLGIIESLEAKIKDLEEKRKEAFSVDAIRAFNNQIEALKNQLEDLNKNVGAAKVVSTLEAYQSELKDLADQFQKTDIADRAGLVTTAAKIASTEILIDRLERLKKANIGQESLVAGPGIRDTSDLFDPEKFLKDQGDKTDAIFEKLADKAKKGTEKIKKIVSDIGPSLASSIGGALTGLGEALGESLAGVGDFGKNALKVIVAFAKQLGEILIGIGTAMLAAKALISNPYTAIIAGVALVALAGAASVAISKAHSNTIGGGASAASVVDTTAVTSAGRYVSSTNNAQEVNFRIEGPALVGTLNNTNYQNGRLLG